MKQTYTIKLTLNVNEKTKDYQRFEDIKRLLENTSFLNVAEVKEG